MFQAQIEVEKQRLAAKMFKKPEPKMPKTLPDALRYAADLVEYSEQLERQLAELQSREFPEVLQSSHIVKLLGISKSTLSEWAKHPDFPHLDGAWKKGNLIRVLKSDFYDWLKNRKGGAA